MELVTYGGTGRTGTGPPPCDALPRRRHTRTETRSLWLSSALYHVRVRHTSVPCFATCVLFPVLGPSCQETGRVLQVVNATFIRRPSPIKVKQKKKKKGSCYMDYTKMRGRTRWPSQASSEATPVNKKQPQTVGYNIYQYIDNITIFFAHIGNAMRIGSRHKRTSCLPTDSAPGAEKPTNST